MVTAKEPYTCQQFSARNSSSLDHMALRQNEENYSLPCSFLPTRNPDVGNCASSLPGLNLGEKDSVGGFLKLLPPYCNISNPSGNPYLKHSQYAPSHGFCFTGKPFGAPQKRFLIFDQSGNHTRLFFSPSFSSQDRIFASKIPASGNVTSIEVATRVDHQSLMKPTVEEKWDENHLSDGEGDMLEDTDEINALLYSDSDDDEYDDNSGDEGENDEVTSTRHSPFSFEEGCNKDKSFHDELTQQVASSDGNSLKRQRLLDGRYKKSSLESGERAVLGSYEDDLESSCAGYRTPHDDDIDSNKRANKAKIRQALKILETIIPGSDSSDPLSIIDKAVACLKSMKAEAEALGLSHP